MSKISSGEMLEASVVKVREELNEIGVPVWEYFLRYKKWKPKWNEWILESHVFKCDTEGWELLKSINKIRNPKPETRNPKQQQQRQNQQQKQWQPQPQREEAEEEEAGGGNTATTTRWTTPDTSLLDVGGTGLREQLREKQARSLEATNNESQPSLSEEAREHAQGTEACGNDDEAVGGGNDDASARPCRLAGVEPSRDAAGRRRAGAQPGAQKPSSSAERAAHWRPHYPKASARQASQERGGAGARQIASGKDGEIAWLRVAGAQQVAALAASQAERQAESATSEAESAAALAASDAARAGKEAESAAALAGSKAELAASKTESAAALATSKAQSAAALAASEAVLAGKEEEIAGLRREKEELGRARETLRETARVEAREKEREAGEREARLERAEALEENAEKDVLVNQLALADNARMTQVEDALALALAAGADPAAVQAIKARKLA
ncbi:hypothetical protein T484DRAFT_1936596 [Baffinella frigidus]|nr:hypothetical protein T484DRAFT_1936596 [Cryptophyta sp. CCMP2293]